MINLETQVLLRTVGDCCMEAVDPDQYSCALHAEHMPSPLILHHHHIVPLAWTRVMGHPAAPGIAVCAIGHEMLHAATGHLLLGEEQMADLPPVLQGALQPAMAYWQAHEAVLAQASVSVEVQYHSGQEQAPMPPEGPLARWARRLRGA